MQLQQSWITIKICKWQQQRRGWVRRPRPRGLWGIWRHSCWRPRRVSEFRTRGPKKLSIQAGMLSRGLNALEWALKGLIKLCVVWCSALSQSINLTRSSSLVILLSKEELLNNHLPSNYQPFKWILVGSKSWFHTPTEEFKYLISACSVHEWWDMWLKGCLIYHSCGRMCWCINTVTLCPNNKRPLCNCVISTLVFTYLHKQQPNITWNRKQISLEDARRFWTVFLSAQGSKHQPSRPLFWWGYGGGSRRGRQGPDSIGNKPSWR